MILIGQKSGYAPAAQELTLFPNFNLCARTLIYGIDC